MSEFEQIVTEIPGPRSRALAASLAQTESRGVTYVTSDFPIFWESAHGSAVSDVDGNRYLDLNSAFGVASVGHANPAVVQAICRQAARLPHAMGDVHPPEIRVQLLDMLAKISPIADAKSYLGATGADSIEFALKTAQLATGSPNVLAFGGGYHGLSYGTLEINGNPKFRKGFAKALRETTTFVRFPDPREKDSRERMFEHVEKALRKDRSIGAVIVEPIQGRAGVIVPPVGTLSGLRELTKAFNVVFILDEIYTGFGRTGRMFAAQHEAVEPDIICVGKAMGGGFPISAAIASAKIMDAWQPSTGEALHTSTFLGNPMGCAAAIAAIGEVERLGLPARASRLEGMVANALLALKTAPGVVDVRGRGLLWGLEFSDAGLAQACVLRGLRAGVLLLQAGLRGDAVVIAPPLVIEEQQLARALELLTLAVRNTPTFAVR